MSALFDPRSRVSALGARALAAVEAEAAGKPWTFHHLYAAAIALEPTRSSLAKRVKYIGAEWALNHPEVTA